MKLRLLITFPLFFLLLFTSYSQERIIFEDGSGTNNVLYQREFPMSPAYNTFHVTASNDVGLTNNQFEIVLYEFHLCRTVGYLLKIFTDNVFVYTFTPSFMGAFTLITELKTINKP